MNQAFELYDINGDGFIDKGEFNQIMKGLNLPDG